jgi:hypothetical protein
MEWTDFNTQPKAFTIYNKLHLPACPALPAFGRVRDEDLCTCPAILTDPTPVDSQPSSADAPDPQPE